VQLTDAQQKYAARRNSAAKGLVPQSELDAAKIAVDTAQAGLASQEATVNQTQAAVTQSQASVNQNQVNLDHTIITAPIDGIVTQRSVDVGQTVAASMQAPTLFVIAADLTKMQVNANIDEADVGRIRPGQHVTFPRRRLPHRQLRGHRLADPSAARGGLERDDIWDGHRRAQPAAEAQAGHDGERQGRNRQAL
jgi:HlyD family secretion protein